MTSLSRCIIELSQRLATRPTIPKKKKKKKNKHGSQDVREDGLTAALAPRISVSQTRALTHKCRLSGGLMMLTFGSEMVI